MLPLIIAPLTIGPSIDPQIAGAVVESHVRSLVAGISGTFFVWTDRQAVKPCSNGKLDFSPPVNDFSEGRIPTGGWASRLSRRLLGCSARLSARQACNQRFIWPSAGTAPSDQKIEIEHGYSVEPVTADGMNC